MGSNISTAASAEVAAVLDGVRRIVQGLRVSSGDTERRVGLTAAQLFVLRQLSDGAPLSVNELARRTFTHQSSVSVVASRLVARGLVTRGTDARDGRRRLLTLTSAGRRALLQAPESAPERLVSAVKDLAPTTRRTTARALSLIADGMLVGDRPSMFFEERGRS